MILLFKFFWFIIMIKLDYSDLFVIASGMFLAFLTLSFSFIIYFFNRKSRINRIFSLYLLVVAIWIFIGAFYIGTGLFAPQMVLVQMAVGVCAGPLFYFFSRALVNEHFKAHWFELMVVLPVIWISVNNLTIVLSPEKYAAYINSIYVVDNTLHRFNDLSYEIYSLSLLFLHFIGLGLIAAKIPKQQERALKNRLIVVLAGMSSGFIFTFILSSVMVILGHPINVMLVLVPLSTGLFVVSVTILHHKAWTVEYLLEVISHHREILQEKINEITFLSQHDYLTGIFNRRYFYEAIESEQQRSRRYKQQNALIMFDIDFFKHINDSYGHETGDKILKEVTRVVSANLRQNDIFARWGGEEFMIFLPHATDEGAIALAEKLRQLIENNPFEKKIKVTCSFGVTTVNADDEYSQKIQEIDKALYDAKNNGRNCIKTYSSSGNYSSCESILENL